MCKNVLSLPTTPPRLMLLGLQLNAGSITSIRWAWVRGRESFGKTEQYLFWIIIMQSIKPASQIPLSRSSPAHLHPCHAIIFSNTPVWHSHLCVVAIITLSHLFLFTAHTYITYKTQWNKHTKAHVTVKENIQECHWAHKPSTKDWPCHRMIKKFITALKKKEWKKSLWLMFLSAARWRHLRPSHGGPCSESRRLFLLQHREGLPLHWRWWIRTKVQPDQVWIWLPGWLPLTAVQIQDSCEFFFSLYHGSPLNCEVFTTWGTTLKSWKAPTFVFTITSKTDEDNNNTFLTLFLNVTYHFRTKLSPRLRQECLGMLLLMPCWHWTIHRPCPSSDSQGLMASGWTPQPCSRYTPACCSSGSMTAFYGKNPLVKKGT